jgi:nucleic acid/nucleotide deaminase of polymorphic system toxin
VVAGVRSYPGQQEMDDLTVDDGHTYYVVAGGVAVLVHNVDCLGVKVAYNATRLGNEAYKFRLTMPYKPGRNVGVAVVDVDGESTMLYGWSDGTDAHSEDSIIAQIDRLRSEGKTVGKIKELYSDRTPCPICQGKLGGYLDPNAEVTWAVLYLDPETELGRLVNKQSTALLDEMVLKAMHG